MSTPQPIKLRLERSPPTKKASHVVRRSHMQRSRSAPDLVDAVKKNKKAAFQGKSQILAVGSWNLLIKAYNNAKSASSSQW